MSENDFEDLLSSQGFSSRADRRGPRTVAEMRRQDQARDTDPLKLKVGVPRRGRAGGPGSPGQEPLGPVCPRRQWLLGVTA